MVFLGAVIALIVIAVNVTAKDKFEKPLLKIAIVSNGMVSGSFAKDGRTIYFEAIRGEKNPKGDPNAPKFSVDIRIMDDMGIPFVVRAGGGKMINPQWIEDQKVAEGFILDDNDTLFDFYLLPDFVKALKAFQKKSKNKTPELEELINCAGSVKESDFFDESNPEINTKGISTMATTVYKYKAEIRKKKLDDYPIVEHSALRVRLYTSSGTLKYTFNSCNHGTCADSSKMSTKCTKEWTRSNVSLPIYDKMCDDLTKKGYVAGYHSCNSDTKLQYKTAKDGKFSASYAWGVCMFPYPKAPSCD